MIEKSDDTPWREAVAVFDSVADLEAAVEELEAVGFGRSAISLLASEHAVEEKLGHKYRHVSELEDDFAAPRRGFVADEDVGGGDVTLIGSLLSAGAVFALGAVILSGGAFAAAITAAVIGGSTGGFLGTMLHEVIEKKHARYLRDQLDKGGLLLWVRTRDQEEEVKAMSILMRHSGRDVHVHDVKFSP